MLSQKAWNRTSRVGLLPLSKQILPVDLPVTVFSYDYTMSQRALVIFCFSLLPLTGCISSTSSVQVNEDGSGRIEVTRLIDTNLSANYVSNNGTQFSFSEEDIDTLCRQLATSSNYPDGANVQKVNSGSNCGATISLDVPVSESLSEHLAEIDGSTYGPFSDLFEAPKPEQYVLEQREDQWIFKMPTPSVAQLDNAYLVEADVESILALSTFTYELTLPGTAIEDKNNADVVSAGTFTWDVDPTKESTLLQARTSPPPASFISRVGPLALAGAATLAGLAAAVFLFRLRRRKNSDEPTEPPTTRPTSNAPASTRPTTEQNKTEQASLRTQQPTPKTANPIQPPPLGTSDQRWDEDAGIWLADHKIDGVLFYDDDTQTWEQLK